MTLVFFCVKHLIKSVGHVEDSSSDGLLHGHCTGPFAVRKFRLGLLNY